MIKYLSLFSGIGAFEKAMVKQGIDFELVGFSEIDEYAVKSYCAIHNVDESLNLGDITKIDETKLPKVDFVTYGFPCQDISLAGKQQGLFHDDGTLTRSGLFFDALRIIEHCKPKVAIAENVKNLTSKKFSKQFKIVLDSLEEAGYNNYWQILNAKNYGIPQNRERVFIVSIRKDIDTGMFQFPDAFPLELRLKDVLEVEVDKKYYLSNEKIAKIQNSNFAQEKAMIQKGDVCGTLLARDYKDPKCVQVANEYIQMATNNGIAIPAAVDEQNRYVRKDGCIGSLTTDGSSPKHNSRVIVENEFRIRKVTPKECFRLMGFDDSDFLVAKTGSREVTKELLKKYPNHEGKGFMAEVERISKMSNTQLYKQAGNSIVVDVAEELLCMMFDEDGDFYV